MSILNIIPDVGVQPRVSLMVEAAALKTALALSKVRLFKDTFGIPNVNTTLALLDAHQADFSGYTAGGNTITAFGDPYADPDGSGVLLVAPTTQFNFLDPDPDPAVPNDIGGFYVVDAAGALRYAVAFEEAVTLGDNEQSLPIVVGVRID